MIEARSLSKSFGATRALQDVSFTVNIGEVVGFLGPNGAGKSTTMKMLSGVLAADAGAATLGSIDLANDRIKAQQNLGYMPEAAGGFADLTVLEFLTFCAEARQMSGQDTRDAIAQVGERTFLTSAFNKPMRTLSKGWRQRAWFAQAVLHSPSALILDEPTDGLDPGQKDHIRDYIREMAAKTAVIFSTHILQEAEELCDRVIIITQGRVVKDDKITSLLDKSGRLAPAFAQLTAADSLV